MTPQELAQYAKMCKKHGIRTLEIGNIKLTMDLSMLPPVTSELPKEEPEMDEETLALWSSQS